eukprot:TRINITY_DN496_c0_g1_i23.p1 TRINITY_DN496_c0_g1~~TRINITY_DN496_c0_g1_i23.p1  ORF type:complete len:213 (-),score=57.44 TRINITY_DN496_c0_g1_i23:978-1616(-)
MGRRSTLPRIFTSGFESLYKLPTPSSTFFINPKSTPKTFSIPATPIPTNPTQTHPNPNKPNPNPNNPKPNNPNSTQQPHPQSQQPQPQSQYLNQPQYQPQYQYSQSQSQILPQTRSQLQGPQSQPQTKSPLFLQSQPVSYTAVSQTPFPLSQDKVVQGNQQEKADEELARKLYEDEIRVLFFSSPSPPLSSPFALHFLLCHVLLASPFKILV